MSTLLTPKKFGNKLNIVKPYSITYLYNGELDCKEYGTEEAMHAFYMKLPKTAAICFPLFKGERLNWKGRFFTAKQIAQML